MKLPRRALLGLGAVLAEPVLKLMAQPATAQDAASRAFLERVEEVFIRKTEDHDAERVPAHFSEFTPEGIIDGYVARFPTSYAFTLKFEGGYVNDPHDPGGCTNRGITIHTLRDWRGDPRTNCTDVLNLSPVEAGMIYALNYWRPVMGNQLPIGLNTAVWDFGVNAGPRRAVRLLQRCVGSTQDGLMGPITLGKARDADLPKLLDRYHEERARYYRGLRTFPRYGRGWLRRNEACHQLSMTLRNEGPNPRPQWPGHHE